METQVINDNSCIRIINDGVHLLVIKTKIRAIDTVKNELVRIDIGEGALRHIYINYADVTLPAGLADAAALRDSIKNMVDPPAIDLTSLIAALQYQNVIPPNTSVTTSAQQLNAADAQTQWMNAVRLDISGSADIQIALLANITQVLNQIKTSLNAVNDDFKYPVRVDTSVQRVVYYGFAQQDNVNTLSPSDAKWAIQKITTNGQELTYQWANGTKQFANTWDDRYNLGYKAFGG